MIRTYKTHILFHGIALAVFFACFSAYAFTSLKVGFPFANKLIGIFQAVCAISLILIFSHKTCQSILNNMKGLYDGVARGDSLLSKNFAIIIVIACIAITVIHLTYISSYIQFTSHLDNPHVEKLLYAFTIIGSSVGILINWLLLSALSYLLATALDIHHNFNFYVSAVGIGQIGMFLAIFTAFLMSLLTLDSMMSISHFAEMSINSYERNMIGKFGEFVMLFIICCFLMLNEKISSKYAVIIAFVPTLLVGFISELVKFLTQNLFLQ